jgi:hypothetical protein
MEPGTGYLVMASHLPLKRITATVRFFRGVSAVRKQLAAADGLIGYTLRAKPLARDYWTLSVWKDNATLREFMRVSWRTMAADQRTPNRQFCAQY